MGGIAQTLAHIGNRMREDHLLDLQDRINKQNQSLDFLSSAYQNPQIAPEDRAGIFQLLLDTSGTPAAKYDPTKTSKKFADLMAQSHDRAVGVAQEQSQQTPANLKFAIPGGNYNAGGFESAPPLPPVSPAGMPQLPSGGNPFLEKIQQFLSQGSASAATPMPEPPAYRAGAPNMAAMPGAPTEMEMPGLNAPGPNVPGAVQPFFSPEREAQYKVHLAEMMAPAEAAKYKAQYGAQYQAQLEHDMALAGFKHEQTMKMLNDFKKQGFNHFSEAIGANGEPTIKPDPGRMIAGIVPGGELEGEVDPKTGKPLEQGKFYRIREFTDGTREYFVQTNVKDQRIITDPSTGQAFLVALDRNGLEIPGSRIATVNTAILPRTSVLNTPGLPPMTTTTRPILPGGVAAPGQGTSAVPPNPPGGGAARPTTGAKVQSDSFPAAIKARAKSVADGSQPMPTDARTAGAVQQYMAEHNLQLPTPMTAAGQAAMAQVDPVLAEVQDLKKFLEDNKLKDNTQRAFFGPKFLNYRAGGDTPYNEFFTGASFESLRSAAAALKGSNSRAMPILNKALVHTPNLWLDSPKNIYEKLNAVERILSQSRSSILNDQRKSGVVNAPESSSPPNPPAQEFKAGDTVMYNGAPHKIKSVDPKTGKLTLEP